MAKIFLKLS